MITRDFFRSRIVNEVSLIALGTFAALGPSISPSVALGLPLRIDIAALAFLGVLTLLPGRSDLPGPSGAGRVGGKVNKVRALGAPLVAGGLLGAAFVAPWAAFPWLVLPALAIAWSGEGRRGRLGGRGSGLGLALLAAALNSALVAGASTGGLRISPEDFDARDFRVNNLLADVSLHDVWAIDLKGHPSPTLEELGGVFRGFSPFQITPAIMGLGMLREMVNLVLGWDDPRWNGEAQSFVHRLSETDRQHSTTEPGKTYGAWRVLYAWPREGVAETINGTAHVAVAATIAGGPEAPRLFLSFRVREVNWTTPFYMRMIDPARRFFVYPFLLRQFAHSWKRGGWRSPDELQYGEEK